MPAITIGAGVEVDCVGAAGERCGVKVVTERPVVSDRSTCQHRPVLQVVGARIDVACVIGSDTVVSRAGAEVDTGSRVGKDRVAANRIATATVQNRDTRTGTRVDLATEGDDIAFAGSDSADGCVGCVFDQHPAFANAPVLRASRIGSDDVALNQRAIIDVTRVQLDPRESGSRDQVANNLSVVRTTGDVESAATAEGTGQIVKPISGRAEIVVLNGVAI